MAGLLFLTSEYLELSGKEKFPFCMASVLSPKGRLKKQSLYRRQPKAQISALVVMDFPL